MWTGIVCAGCGRPPLSLHKERLAERCAPQGFKTSRVEGGGRPHDLDCTWLLPGRSLRRSEEFVAKPLSIPRVTSRPPKVLRYGQHFDFIYISSHPVPNTGDLGHLALIVRDEISQSREFGQRLGKTLSMIDAPCCARESRLSEQRSVSSGSRPSRDAWRVCPARLSGWRDGFAGGSAPMPKLAWPPERWLEGMVMAAGRLSAQASPQQPRQRRRQARRPWPGCSRLKRTIRTP